MSDSGAGAGRREVAWRVFAAEYDDAWYSYSQSDEERAPNYVVTPTGARVNRLFVVGVLTEVEPVSDDVLRARVVDPTGPFVVYAGQYQPDAVAFLERVEPPAFVAVTGKARTFQPDDADVVYTSIRPESMSEVDAATRDRWVVSTAEHTLDRVTRFADALDRVERGDDLEGALLADGVDIGLAAGVPRAVEQYGTTPAYLDAVRDTALDAARVVAGEREEVSTPDLAPDEGGDADVEASFSIAADGVSGTADEDGETVGAGPAGAGATGGDGTADEQSDGDAAAGGDDAGDAGEAERSGDAGPVEAAASAGGSGSADADGASGGDAGTSEPAGDGSPAGDGDVSAVGDGSESSAGDGDVSAVGDGSESSAGDEDVSASEVAAEVGDEMYEMDDEERERIESEFDTEFTTGAELSEDDADAGEPDAPDSPAGDGADGEADAAGDATAGDETDETTGDATGDADEAAAGTGDGSADAGDAGDAADGDLDGGDLEDVVVEYMQDLDDGDGAPEDDLVAAVADDYGVAEREVRDAIQDALMAGRCFEPDDAHVKPI